MNASIKELLQQIKNFDHIVLAGHTSPDGDAISACLALAQAIKKLGKNPTVLLENIPETYSYLKGSSFVYDKDTKNLTPELFIALDCGDISRLGKVLPLFNTAKVTANIDHHASNDDFANINIVNKTASSTSEIVFEVIDFIALETKTDILDIDIANCLYTGIVFDTCGFKHSSTSPRTHHIAGVLLEKGVDSSFIHNQVIYTHSIENAKLLATAIQNLYIKDGIAISTLSKEEIFEKCSASYEDLEGISGYLLDIKGVNVAGFLIEVSDEKTKVSLRSKFLDVNSVAQKFGGGGHILASGAKICTDLKSAKDLVLKELISLNNLT